MSLIYLFYNFGYVQMRKMRLNKLHSLSFYSSKNNEFRTLCNSRNCSYFPFLYILVKFAPVFLKHPMYIYFLFQNKKTV